MRNILVFFLQAFFLDHGKKKNGANSFQPTMDNNKINFSRVVEIYIRKGKNPYGCVFTNVSMKRGNGNSRLPGFVYVNRMETGSGEGNDKHSRPVVIVYDFNAQTAEARRKQAKEAAEKLDADMIYVTVGCYEYNGRDRCVMSYEHIKTSESFRKRPNHFTQLKNGPSNLHPNYSLINESIVFFADEEKGYKVICPLSGVF